MATEDMFWGAKVSEGGSTSEYTSLFGPGYGTEDTWFNPPNYRTNEGFDIVTLKPWVMNQQPAHISALADQFHNAVTALIELENWIFPRATQLYNEIWTESKARAEFMRRGPGLVLAFIHDWKMRLSDNESALRSLLDPIHNSMTAMDALWKKYEAAIATASDRSNITWEEYDAAVNPTWHDGLNPFSVLNDSAQIDQFIQARLNAAKKKFDQDARNIVGTLSDAYGDAFFKMHDATGSMYDPPDVVMMPPGKRLPPLPGGGAPPGFNGSPVPSVAPPPPPPALSPTQLQQLGKTGPNVTAPPNVPGGPPGIGPGKVPVGPPVGAPGLRTTGPGGIPGGGPGFANLRTPGAMPAGLPGGAPGGLPNARTGVSPNSFNSPLPPPGVGRGLSRGVLRNPGGSPGAGMVPPGAGMGRRSKGSTLRSPAANYTATGGMPGGAQSGGMMPPPGAGAGIRRQARGVPTVRTGGGVRLVSEAFTQSSLPPPVAPVLGRQNRQGRRSSETPAVPPGGMRGAFAPPTAAPPVLDATMSRGAGSMLPPPAGISPQQRSRRGRQIPAVAAGGAGGGPDGPGQPLLPGGSPGGQRSAGRYTGRPAPNLVGNPDWIAETGPDESESTAPVLRNQAVNPETGVEPGAMLPAQPGATAPVLSRSRAAVQRAMAENRTRPGGRQPSETELARRTREADHHGRPAAEQETRPGEEAFTVQTPGGAVLGGNAPTRDEGGPRPTVGNN